MKLDAGRFTIATANVAAAAALVCALLYKVSPGGYADTANFLVHTDMFTATRPFGWGELILATIVWWALAAILAGAVVSLYNRSVRA